MMKRLSWVVAAMALLLGGVRQARATQIITFDTDAFGNPISAPSLFSATTRLAEEYAPLGVHFSGPGNNNGGAILNQSSNFGVNALSGSNFLAFNRTGRLADGGIPTDPETIAFDTLQTAVSIFASGGFDTNTFRMDAFDVNGLLVDSDTVTTPPGSWLQLSVDSSDGISRVTLTGIGADNAFVYDNLSFTPVPEPSTIQLLSSSTLALLAYGWRQRRKLAVA